MRLSESLRKGIMETRAGRIISKFKAYKRRYVLFFEDILAEYIKECEENGHEKEIREISRKWANLVSTLIVVPVLRKLPLTLTLVMKISKRVWISIGALDDLKISRKGDVITMKTYNEHITRVIGENRYTEGVFEGMISVLSKYETRCTSKSQTPDFCTYTFEIGKKPLKKIESKEKTFYDRLNHSETIEGVDFKDA